MMESIGRRVFEGRMPLLSKEKKVTSQLADIYIDLKAHPFAMTGPMHPPGSHNIGPFARESLTEFHDSQMKELGPYSSTEE
jgi:hypothetical protein